MAEEFIDDRPISPAPPLSQLPQRDRETVRIILVGSQQGIETVIYRLFTLRFAEIHEWSRLQPEPHSGKWMSVMTKAVGSPREEP